MGKETGKIEGVGLAQVRRASWLGPLKWYPKDTFKISIKFGNNSFFNMFVKFSSACKNDGLNIFNSFLFGIFNSEIAFLNRLFLDFSLHCGISCLSVFNRPALSANVWVSESGLDCMLINHQKGQTFSRASRESKSWFFHFLNKVEFLVFSDTRVDRRRRNCG